MNCSKQRRVAPAAFAVLFWLFAQSAGAAELRNPNDDPAFGDAVAGERFGTSVVVDGTTAVVGSFAGRDALGNHTGSVRVFTRQGAAWSVQAKIVAPDGRSWDAFGSALALEGDTLIVGASNHSRNEEYYLGAVYVFERDGGAWNHSQTLSRPEPVSGAFFGSALVLAGDTLVVGAPQVDIGSIESAGSVTVFKRDALGWQPEQTILAPNPSHVGMFGSSLVFSGDDLLVGSYGENLQGGAVYSFARDGSGWVLRQRLVGSQVVPSDFFGVSLAADDTRLLVGAPGYLQNHPGSAVEWRRQDGLWVESATHRPANDPDVRHFGIDLAHRGGDAWFIGAERAVAPPGIAAIDLYTYQPVNNVLAQTGHASVPYVGNPGHVLVALATDGADAFLGLPYRVAAPWSDAGEVLVIGAGGAQSALSAGVTATFEQFGAAVAANGRWLLVGTPGERRLSALAGAVFAYDLENFAALPAAALIDADGERGDGFGTSLALSGDTLLVGSPRDDASGAVQAWEYSGTQWQRTARWAAPRPGFNFGSVLAADASTFVVGSPFETSPPDAPESAAYVYQRDGAGWLPPVRLVATAATGNEAFGMSVAVDGDVIAVGSLAHESGAFGEPVTLDGVARVFEHGPGGWMEVAHLARPASPAPDGDFGSSVAVAGHMLFVGAPGVRELHVFQRQAGQWTWTQRIDAPPTSAGSFGARARVIDGDLWVSAPGYYGPHRGTLHRYAFVGGMWTAVQSLPAPPLGEWFGADFAVEAGTVFVGVPWAAGHAPFVRGAGRVDIGAVNVFGSGFEQ